MKITKKMRFLLIVLSVVMAFSLFACDNTPEETTAETPEVTTEKLDEITTGTETTETTETVVETTLETTAYTAEVTTETTVETITETIAETTTETTAETTTETTDETAIDTSVDITVTEEETTVIEEETTVTEEETTVTEEETTVTEEETTVTEEETTVTEEETTVTEEETTVTEEETTVTEEETTVTEEETTVTEEETTVTEEETTVTEEETTVTEEETTVTEEETTEENTETEDDVEKIDNISAISPEDGETVLLANKLIHKWWMSFDGTSRTYPEIVHEDRYFPVPVELEWECKEDAIYYLVYLSTSKDMSGANSFVTNKTSLVVENLFVGTDYYWQVDAIFTDKTLRSEVFAFTTANSTRAVTIEGVSNTRDIGGVYTADGNRIKQGMIYRGGKLNDITELGKRQFLYDLGIKTDLDLRSNGEGGAGLKSPVSGDLRYYQISGRYYIGGSGIDTEEGKKIMAEEIRLFTDPDNYPFFIHCSLGRDRTGTIVFILQALCGVEKKDLLREYELSIFSVTGTLDNANPVTHLVSTYNYIVSNYSGASFAEKTENYLLSIGITADEIATIRSLLIEEVK